MDKASSEKCENGGDAALVPVSMTDDVEKPSILQSLRSAPLQIQSEVYEQPLYSEYLRSQIIALRVGEERKTYHLHSALLCRESERFNKSLNSPHRERQEFEIDLYDEPVELFTRFVDFIYMPEWKPTCESGSDLVLLAELYAMGERFLAAHFQRTIYRSFIESCTRFTLEKAELCRLLAIACDNITERSNPADDPMREHIFWLGASRMTDLQKSDNFRALLWEQQTLGYSLCLRAGNGTTSQPQSPFPADNTVVKKKFGRKF